MNLIWIVLILIIGAQVNASNLLFNLHGGYLASSVGQQKIGIYAYGTIEDTTSEDPSSTYAGVAIGDQFQNFALRINYDINFPSAGKGWAGSHADTPLYDIKSTVRCDDITLDLVFGNGGSGVKRFYGLGAIYSKALLKLEYVGSSWSGVENETVNGVGKDFGGRAFVGLESKITSFFCFSGEIGYRFLKISEFLADGNQTGPGGIVITSGKPIRKATAIPEGYNFNGDKVTFDLSGVYAQISLTHYF